MKRFECFSGAALRNQWAPAERASFLKTGYDAEDHDTEPRSDQPGPTAPSTEIPGKLIHREDRSGFRRLRVAAAVSSIARPFPGHALEGACASTVDDCLHEGVDRSLNGG